MISARLMTYILEICAVALLSRYVLGNSPLDHGAKMLLIIVVVSHIASDTLEAPSAPQASTSTQRAGMGLQTALMTQRQLMHQDGGRVIEASEPAQIDYLSRFIDDRAALHFYNKNYDRKD